MNWIKAAILRWRVNLVGAEDGPCGSGDNANSVGNNECSNEYSKHSAAPQNLLNYIDWNTHEFLAFGGALLNQLPCSGSSTGLP